MIKYLRLTNGQQALIDEEDFERVKDFTWGRGYGGRKSSYVGTNLKGLPHRCVLLHRFIMGTPKGLVTDHINGDVLDNRRSNLRICTAAQNSYNSHKTVPTTSSYKGVCWYKRDNCWRAYVGSNRRQIHLGYFESEKAAAQAYNVKAVEVFGEYACLNIV